MSAIRRKRPPHRGQASTSNPNVRLIRSAHSRFRPWPRPPSALLRADRTAPEAARSPRRHDRRRRVPDHRRPPGRPRRQDAVIENQIDPRPRHEHRQPPEKVHRIPLQVRRAIGPPMPELQPHATVAAHAEPLPRHRRTQRIPAHAFESFPLPGRHEQARVEVEAVRSRVAPAGRGRLDRSRAARPVAGCGRRDGGRAPRSPAPTPPPARPAPARRSPTRPPRRPRRDPRAPADRARAGCAARPWPAPPPHPDP